MVRKCLLFKVLNNVMFYVKLF